MHIEVELEAEVDLKLQQSSRRKVEIDNGTPEFPRLTIHGDQTSTFCRTVPLIGCFTQSHFQISMVLIAFMQGFLSVFASDFGLMPPLFSSGLSLVGQISFEVVVAVC